MMRKDAIGVILPSSNRTVERVARSLLAHLPDLDICCTRVPYGGHPAGGYALEPFRAAAALLAEARPGVILWNATRGAMLGFEPDRALCAMIEDMTGIRATTTALATLEQLRERNLERVALVVQGEAAECERVGREFRRQGVGIVAGEALGVTDNFAAATVPPARLAAAAERLADGHAPDAILIWSTNLGGYGMRPPPGRPETIVLDSATIGFDAALARLRPAAGIAAASALSLGEAARG